MPHRTERVDAVFLVSLRSVLGKKILDDARSFTSYMCHIRLAFPFFDNGSTTQQKCLDFLYQGAQYKPDTLSKTSK